jgi:hypothetical protein
MIVISLHCSKQKLVQKPDITNIPAPYRKSVVKHLHQLIQVTDIHQASNCKQIV